jgi:HprK-related kinase A
MELAHQLAEQGINLQIGPFVVGIQSSIASVVEGIRLLYANYPVRNGSTFVDFHVSLKRPRSQRRWIRPQVLFSFDGAIPFKPLPISQAFPLFEWGLNWCVGQHANQYLIIHAAVVEKEGQALVMVAPPGSGKSTLCAGLITNGWRILSDELALISSEDGLLTPIPRPVSLKNASIEVIRKFAPEATMGRVSADTSKGRVAHMKVPDDSVTRAAECARPAWVVCLQYKSGTPSRLERRSKGKMFMHVIKNAFNYHVLGVQGYQTTAALIDGCNCYDFSYSCLEEAISVFEML